MTKLEQQILKFTANQLEENIIHRDSENGIALHWHERICSITFKVIRNI